jgi:hydroxyacylglutathione hydrolase
MKIHQIGGCGYDSNIYLIIDEIIALVDTGTGKNFDIVSKNLRKFGLTPADIELIINTHCHYDHVGGDRAFVNAADCGVAIHELDAEPLRKGDEVVTCAILLGEKLRAVEPTRLLHDGDRIELGSLLLDVIHTPGHTQGSVCLYDHERSLLFSGDTVFCEDIGRVDLPTGDHGAIINSLKKLAKLKLEQLLPGHGPIVEEGAGAHIMSALESL